MNTAQFKLPDVGEGLTEADILTWKVAAGDAVKVNQVIVEIETAKPVVELPCPTAGSVAALLAPEGATVEVGTPIIDIVAEDAGVDLAALTGTGAAGEVTRRDFAQHLVGTGGLPEVARMTSPGTPEGDETWTIPLKGVRKATAQAMVASAFTAPHVTEFLDVDVTRTMELVARSCGAEGYARVTPRPCSRGPYAGPCTGLRSSTPRCRVSRSRSAAACTWGSPRPRTAVSWSP